MNLDHLPELITALGWTLLHFVWQGAVVAALVAVAWPLLRAAPPNARYLAGCLALLLLAVAPLATYSEAVRLRRRAGLYCRDLIHICHRWLLRQAHSVQARPR